MQAQVGDVIIIEGNSVGSPPRRGTIVEVRSADGSPPYWVKWDDGHEGLSFPGPDAHVTGHAPGDPHLVP